jgi:hypothetical protein
MSEPGTRAEQSRAARHRLFKRRAPEPDGGADGGVAAASGGTHSSHSSGGDAPAAGGAGGPLPTVASAPAAPGGHGTVRRGASRLSAAVPQHEPAAALGGEAALGERQAEVEAAAAAAAAAQRAAVLTAQQRQAAAASAAPHYQDVQARLRQQQQQQHQQQQQTATVIAAAAAGALTDAYSRSAPSAALPALPPLNVRARGPTDLPACCPSGPFAGLGSAAAPPPPHLPVCSGGGGNPLLGPSFSAPTPQPPLTQPPAPRRVSSGAAAALQQQMAAVGLYAPGCPNGYMQQQQQPSQPAPQLMHAHQGVAQQPYMMLPGCPVPASAPMAPGPLALAPPLLRRCGSRAAVPAALAAPPAADPNFLADMWND